MTEHLVRNDSAGWRAPSLLCGDRARPEPIMAARGLALGFGPTTVISGVTVDFPPGTVTALVGPSGSGKTTFLRSLNRMNDKVRGSWKRGVVELHGQEVDSPRLDPLVLRRRVGMVFQRPNPFPMSIRDNVVAGVKAHRMAKRSELQDLAEARLAQVGLWSAVAGRLGDSPFRLSGGQQQRLCLARALAVEPEVLLLDEPTSSLDPRSTEAIEQLVRQLVPRVTVVLVTHDLAQAERVSDRTIFFSEGHLVESGPTRRLFEEPEHPETARYLFGEALATRSS